MAYSSGMLSHRITIYRKTGFGDPYFGGDCGYKELTTVWGAVDFTRGQRALREGAMEAYDIVMVRFRWLDGVDRDCLLKVDGDETMYNIQSLHIDRERNTIQITAAERPGVDVP